MVTGEDVESPKPDPEGVPPALQGLSLSQSQVLVVDDSVVDIQAGRRAGMVTGAALWGLKDFRDLWRPSRPEQGLISNFKTVAELDRFLFRRLVR